MAANPTPMVSVEEYLHTAYDPDCDYVDGYVEERNAGEGEHSALQIQLGYFLVGVAKSLNVRAWSEQRLRINPNRFRIPDLCVTRGRGPLPRILEVAPVICIEILSREDRLARLLKRAADYASIGVPHVWIVDPIEREAFVYRDNALKLIGDGILEAPEIGLTVNLAEIFAAIDE
jgi:Uma2 family endonuclease